MKWLSLRFRLKTARADTNGAAAVEFALIAIPFFGLLFALLETALAYVAVGMLQSAVVEVGRTIMTGESRSLDEAAFRKLVCDRLVIMIQCESKLALDIRTLKSLQGVGRANPYVNGSYNTSAWVYNPGGPGDIVIVTAAYPWPSVVSLIAQGKPQVLMAASAFKNEQF